MKILILGGAGVISTAVRNELAAEHEVACMCRTKRDLPEGVRLLQCDANDEQAARAVLGDESFDAVVDFITFTPEQAEERIRLFKERCGRYLFISTATVYQKPPKSDIITEDTPCENPFSAYARNKIRCEEIFHASGMPTTVVRPFMTYDDSRVPFILRPHNQSRTLIERLRAGKPILMPGDGKAVNTITRSEDFARGIHGLLKNPASIGASLHIAQDEHQSWNDLIRLMAQLAGAPEPTIVNVPVDAIIRIKPETEGDLWGDKAFTNIFDNTALRRYVPGFTFEWSTKDGIARSIAAMDANQTPLNPEWDAWCDQVIADWESGKLQA